MLRQKDISWQDIVVFGGRKVELMVARLLKPLSSLFAPSLSSLFTSSLYSCSHHPCILCSHHPCILCSHHPCLLCLHHPRLLCFYYPRLLYPYERPHSFYITHKFYQSGKKIIIFFKQEKDQFALNSKLTTKRRRLKSFSPPTIRP